MRKYLIRSAYLALSAVSACSGDDDGDRATATGPEQTSIDSALPGGQNTGAPPAGGTEQPAAPGGTAAPTETQPGDLEEVPAVTPGALQPAVRVTENPDHDQLLSSAVPDLAANKRLVYDMWRTLIEARDTEAAEQYIAEGYIQHNPNADTGRDGVLAFFAGLGAPLAVQERVQARLVSIVAEGDIVVMARVDEYTEPRPYTTTWFDSFRIEDGLIAEHWDHGRLPAGGSPAAYVPTEENLDQQGALASPDAELASNKQLVHEMWRTLLDAQQVEEAPRFLAEGYVQHNPQANTGLQGFLAFFRQFAQPQPVQPTVGNFIHMVAENDLVVLATVREYQGASEPYTTTWFDMFRVSDGKLVEHWDTATLE